MSNQRLCTYILIEMKNEQFEVKLLIKQNTEMAIKLQSYRRDNQQLSRKNQNLNCWVQNLSQVFASISAAWKTITDSEEAFYALMRKKTDPNSKAIVSKYIAHFKTFDEIINNLGDKITNEGHSETATSEAKTRIASFVNNYNLFFMEFVESYFKFNDQYLAFINQKMEASNLQLFSKQLMTKELQNRQKIKDFEAYFTQFKENFKIYQGYNKHKLLDGIILQKSKQIETLKDQNEKKTRTISYMVDYCSNKITSILENESFYQCYCGGAQLQYYNKAWQQRLSKNIGGNRAQSHQMIDEAEDDIKEKMKEYHDFEVEKQLLLQRNVQCLNKFQKLKIQNRLTDQIILQSPVFISLKMQFNDLLDYTNDLINKLNKNYQYLNELERARLQQIDELKQKYQKSIVPPKIQTEPTIVIDHKFLTQFKEAVLKEMGLISTFYQSLYKQGKGKEDNLAQAKELMKSLKKQNDDLNRKLNDLQERVSKSVQHLEYRHSKFNELQVKVVEMFKSQPHSEEMERLKKVWEQYVDYVKTRDKKIKAMQDQIRKKDKQINQKVKLQEVLKNALSETQAIYMQNKERLDKFDQFMAKMEKELLNLSEQNYKLKIQSDQEKNFLTIRLKNQTEVKSKLEERVKHLQKIEAQIRLIKQKQIEVDRRFQEFINNQRETLSKVKLQLKQKQREIGQLNQLIQEKDKNNQKIIEQKERKNLQINKLRMKLKAIEQKTEYQVLKMELQTYKSKIMCRCGAQRQRQVVLTTCPHIFCKKCIQDSVGNRNRKCPICSTRFTKTDVHQICWT